MRRVVALVGLVVVLSAGLAVPADAGDQGEQFEGEIFSFGITVPPDPIEVGDTIVFPNGSDRPHTITDRGNTFDTGEIQPGTTGSVTFDTPGRFEIFCQINPSTMNAVVEVGPGLNPPDRTRVQLYDEFRESETRRFDPADITVDEGTELVVANVGGLQHTLTADDGSFSTGVVEPGAEQGRFAGTSATFVAEEGGTFAFHCEIHPDEMRGVLRVIADEPPETTTTTTPPDTAAEAAAPPPDGDSNGDAAAMAAAVGVVALGLGAIVLALTAGGRRRPAPEAF